MRADPEAAADRIHIHELELFARVGVPETERATPQRLVANIEIWPAGDLRELHDDLQRTVDYSALAETARRFAAEHSHKLLETWADALAGQFLTQFAIREVTVELRKFVLPDAEYVAVIVTRRAPAD